MTIDEMMDRGLRELFRRAKPHTNPPTVWGMSPSEQGCRYRAVLNEATGEITVWRLSRYHGKGSYVTWLPEDIRWHL